MSNVTFFSAMKRKYPKKNRRLLQTSLNSSNAIDAKITRLRLKQIFALKNAFSEFCFGCFA